MKTMNPQQIVKKSKKQPPPWRRLSR